jgi:hypothetical protein
MKKVIFFKKKVEANEDEASEDKKKGSWNTSDSRNEGYT